VTGKDVGRWLAQGGRESRGVLTGSRGFPDSNEKEVGMALILVQLIVDGLGMGLIYVLLAAGFNLILSIPGIFFIAYGEFYLVGAYVIWGMLVKWELPFFISLVMAVLVTAILGAISHRLIFQRIQFMERRFLANVVAAIGLMMVLKQAALLVFGTESRGMPSVFPGMINIAGVGISVEKVALILFALAVALGLYFILQKTNIGRGMRAVSFRADVAALQGVNPSRMYLVTMVLGCAISGFAGGIMAPVFALSPSMGSIILPVMFVIMLGGIGSMLGSVVGGLILGMTIAFGHYFIGSGVAQIMLYAIIGIVIFFRPGGLFGQPEEMGL
jgi:branched-chain amino acid transport system permease protein